MAKDTGDGHQRRSHFKCRPRGDTTDFTLYDEKGQHIFELEEAKKAAAIYGEYRIWNRYEEYCNYRDKD
jgi:hypothetical protein